MKYLQSLILVLLIILSGGNVTAQKKSDIKKVTGTWEFNAPEAPPEYSTGDLVISKDGKELAGEIVFSEYYKIQVHDMKLEGNVLTFRAYIEGETITVENEITDDDMKGKVSYSEGTLELTARRKKK